MLAFQMDALGHLQGNDWRRLRLIVHGASSSCQVCWIRLNIRCTVTRVRPSSAALSVLVWPSSFKMTNFRSFSSLQHLEQAETLVVHGRRDRGRRLPAEKSVQDLVIRFGT